MKIVGNNKFKDYFDYLSGIYGIDDKVILDRSSSNYRSDININGVHRFAICGIVYEYFIKNDEVYYGEKLKELEHKDLFLRKDKIRLASNEVISLIPFNTELNDHHNCSIIDVQPTGHILYPKLIDYKFNKILSAEDIYQKIYDWLSNKNNENVIDNRTDKEKILTNGFDLKTSFRK